MHGVKRLFAWMIPRFDPARFNVSLVSLAEEGPLRGDARQLRRGHHLSREVEVRPDDAAGPAPRHRPASGLDILHLHGYGATTFGRAAAALRRIPVVLHEHANLTDTPWFQKVADRALEPFTDLAIAVSRSTAEFVTGARQVPARKVRVVYLGAPLDEFSRPRTAAEVAEARQEIGARAGRRRGRHGHAAARLEGERVPGRGGAPGARPPPGRPVLPGGGRAAARLRSRRRPASSAWAIASSSSASCATSPGCCRRSTSTCSRRCGKARR